jgi:hypothetical protein
MVTKIVALQESLAIVAGDFELQLNYLEKSGLFSKKWYEWETCIVDELTLQLDSDASYIVRYLEAENLASQEFLDRYSALDNTLKQLSGKKNFEFWTVRALAKDPRWEEIRQLAKVCLALMPESIPGDTSRLVP